MDFIVSVAPIVLLVFLMTKRNATPSHVALPMTALLVYVLQLVYFGTDANLVNATVVKGVLTALTPILIIWGAIFMFRTMEASGGMDVVRGWLNGISANPAAQLMIIGWAFAFLIEGASGFGTPAALAAPILVGLGFPAVRVAILCLIMNSVPVSFGAVGTPTWFGFGQLGLSEAELLRVSAQSALTHAGSGAGHPGDRAGIRSRPPGHPGQSGVHLPVDPQLRGALCSARLRQLRVPLAAGRTDRHRHLGRSGPLRHRTGP